MDEIQRIAIEYYRTTVRLSYYGLAGTLYLLLSVPFLAVSIYLVVALQYSNAVILPMAAAVIFWSNARKIYDNNLIRFLAFYTHSDSKNLTDQKALYLQVLTNHISDTLHETASKFDTIIKRRHAETGLITDDGWKHFRKFLYDPESKSRIISLVIYMISLIAVIVVVKGNEISWFSFVEAVSWSDVKAFLLWSLVIIILAYVIILVPITFAITYAINPLMLRLSISGALVNYLMAELTRLSFRESTMQLTCASSGRAKGARR